MPPPSEVPAYARCSVGIGRWFWVAWESWSDARAGGPAKACGYEPTARAAEAKAIEAAGPDAKPLPGKWASGYKRGGDARPSRTEQDGKNRGRLARSARPAKRASVTSHREFLYSAREADPTDPPGRIVVEKHLVLKKT